MVAAQMFIDALQRYLDDDPITSQWLLPLEPLLHMSYESRFRLVGGVSYYLVYDDAFDRGAAWVSVDEFYARSKSIADEYIRRGYFENLVVKDMPTGGCAMKTPDT